MFVCTVLQIEWLMFKIANAGLFKRKLESIDFFYWFIILSYCFICHYCKWCVLYFLFVLAVEYRPAHMSYWDFVWPVWFHFPIQFILSCQRPFRPFNVMHSVVSKAEKIPACKVRHLWCTGLFWLDAFHGVTSDS